METLHPGLTSILAPLVVVQGVSAGLRPLSKVKRSRVVEEQKFQNTEEDLSYGVQIKIDRELEYLKSPGVQWIVELINKYNVRDCFWWPSQGDQEIKRGTKADLSSGNGNSKGIWFNIKYSGNIYEVIINGSKSSLSPYNKESKFYNALLPLEWMYKYYDYIPAVFISIYEIGNDEAFDDILINEINRVKLKFSSTMIKFVAILVYSNPESARHSRIQNLMAKINMSMNSLFIINGATTENAKLEQAMFIRKLMIGLRQYSTDFFDLQIQKLKKRDMKNENYNEILFSCRNLIKMAMFEQFKAVSDYSTKLLEYSYDKLLQILKTLDQKVITHTEIRKWLDILCIHIVRSCIVLGDPNVAYRKFVFHLQKVKELDGKNFSFNWMSLQYTWMGELVENVNKNIIPVDYTILPTTGIRDKYNSFNMPQNGFIYLQAFNYRNKSVDGYDNRIMLLTAALDSFSSATTRFHRFESRIYVLLGDVYCEKENFSMAVNNYLAGISVFKREKCNIIVISILKKILECYIKLGKVKEASGVYIELCVSTTSTNEELEEVKERIMSLDLVNDSECGLLDEVTEIEKPVVKDILIVDVGIQKQKNMMNDGFDAQLLIRRPCKDFEIDGLEVDFKGLKKYIILQGGESRKISVGDVDDCIPALLEFSSCGMFALQMHILCNQVGKFELPEVAIKGSIKGIDFIGICENGCLKQSNSIIAPEYFQWFDTNEVYLRTKTFELLPRIPIVKCSLKYDKIGFNGRRMPLLMKFENGDEKTVIKAFGKGLGILLDVHEVPVVWNDKESFETREIHPGEQLVIKGMMLVPQINGLPWHNVEHLIDTYNLRVKLDIDYMLVNEGGVHIGTVKEAKANIVEMIEWHTKLQTVINGVSGMNYTRRWLFHLSLRNKSFNDLELSRYKFSIKGPKGVEFSLQPETEYDECVIPKEGTKLIKVLLDVSSIDRVVRSIPVDITCDLEYDVGEGAEDYHVDMYKANLPHSDPRMLVTMDDAGDGNKSLVTVKYVIENPTERRFLYQSNLNTIKGVEIINYAKSQRIEVKPYSERVIELQYRVLESGTVELPEFTLYDLQYQVFVKANIADERLRLIDNHLFWRRQ